MSRTARQPIWWIAAAVAFLAINAGALFATLSDDIDVSALAPLVLTLCISVGVVTFAFGYRMGGRHFWWAAAILYLAANAPYVVGILFRLARATQNPAYHLWRSPSFYVFQIVMISFGMTAILRLAQSFRADEDSTARDLRRIFGD